MRCPATSGCSPGGEPTGVPGVSTACSSRARALASSSMPCQRDRSLHLRLTLSPGHHPAEGDSDSLPSAEEQAELAGGTAGASRNAWSPPPHHGPAGRPFRVSPSEAYSGSVKLAIGFTWQAVRISSEDGIGRGHQPLADRLVHHHRAPGDIACGEDVRRARAQLCVNLDVPAQVRLHVGPVRLRRPHGPRSSGCGGAISTRWTREPKALKIEATCTPVAPAPMTSSDGGTEERFQRRYASRSSRSREPEGATNFLRYR